jgi:hypothetical protein
MAATASVGALRYPGLPAYIVNGSGHRVSKSAVSVLIVAGQLYFTVAYSGLMLIIHRSRPDIEAVDPAASTLRYRRFLAASPERPGPTGTTTGSGRPGCSTSTATIPPSWSAPASASAGCSTSGTRSRGGGGNVTGR